MKNVKTLFTKNLTRDPLSIRNILLDWYLCKNKFIIIFTVYDSFMFVQNNWHYMKTNSLLHVLVTHSSSNISTTG